MDEEPLIAISQEETTATASKGEWQIKWVLENRSSRALELSSITIPHGQFKAPPLKFYPKLVVEPGCKVHFLTVVRCSEPAGLVTENAFLIFAGRWGEQPTRLFARIRVDLVKEKGPLVTLQSLTSQRIGVSAEWASTSNG